MAFHMNQDPSKLIYDISNYEKYLKKDTDPTLKAFQSPDGFYLNITRIEQTEEEKKVSEGMEKFYNNYRTILEEKKE